MIEYATKRINGEVKLDYTIKCSNCHLSLSEMENNTALVTNKLSELQVVEMSIVKEAPPPPTKEKRESGGGSPPPPKTPKKLSLKIVRNTTVGDFKKMLQVQLQQVAGMHDTDEIEIDL